MLTSTCRNFITGILGADRRLLCRGKGISEIASTEEFLYFQRKWWKGTGKSTPCFFFVWCLDYHTWRGWGYHAVLEMEPWLPSGKVCALCSEPFLWLWDMCVLEVSQVCFTHFPNNNPDFSVLGQSPFPHTPPPVTYFISDPIQGNCWSGSTVEAWRIPDKGCKSFSGVLNPSKMEQFLSALFHYRRPWKENISQFLTSASQTMKGGNWIL